jgi:hypothetical protein
VWRNDRSNLRESGFEIRSFPEALYTIPYRLRSLVSKPHLVQRASEDARYMTNTQLPLSVLAFKKKVFQHLLLDSHFWAETKT